MKLLVLVVMGREGGRGLGQRLGREHPPSPEDDQKLAAVDNGLRREGGREGGREGRKEGGREGRLETSTRRGV